jgi:membrane-associated phospholipid phosphatase
MPLPNTPDSSRTAWLTAHRRIGRELKKRARSLSAGADSNSITAGGVFRELLLLGLALGAYYGVRLLVRDSGAEALDNSLRLFRWEALLNIDWEKALQNVFLDHLSVVHLLNFIYAWGYWIILVGSLGYLYMKHRPIYRMLRNAMMISGILGFFIFAGFPVAPPRLSNVGMVDTVELSSSVLEEVARPSALTNENAAMPSFHFGWVLLCGLCLFRALKRPLCKALTLTLPLLMGLTIIVTGNHYVVDAVVGGILCLLALVPVTLQLRHSEQEPCGVEGV